MKKQFILVGAIAVMGFGTFLLSCSKDDKSNSDTCSCTETAYDGGYSSSGHTVHLSDFNVSSCSELASKLTDNSSDYYYSCH